MNDGGQSELFFLNSLNLSQINLKTISEGISKYHKIQKGDKRKQGTIKISGAKNIQNIIFYNFQENEMISLR